MQEPDSFSQDLVHLLELPDPGGQLLNLGITDSASIISTFLHSIHHPASTDTPLRISWHEATIQITTDHRRTPTRHHPRRDVMSLKPQRLPPMNLTLILEHELTISATVNPNETVTPNLLD